jgi:hypothetical protein
MHSRGKSLTLPGKAEPVKGAWRGTACPEHMYAQPARPHTLRLTEINHTASEISCRPGGLWTGSPSSPPPRSIRITVRRLPRSPRLSGPGPHQLQFCSPGFGRQGRSHLCDGLKLGHEIRPVLHEVPDDPGIAEELGHVALDDGQLQVILAVGVLDGREALL